MLDAGASGLIVFNDADTFTGNISGFDFNDQIDLRDVVFDPNTGLSYLDNGNGSGVLTITDGTRSIQIAMLGAYQTADFVMASNGQGGLLLTNSRGRSTLSIGAPAGRHAYCRARVPFLGWGDILSAELHLNERCGA